jgi:hypothetical protein
MSISDTCKKTYFPAYHNSGARPLSDVTLIVLHSTEGGTAASVARYFKSPASGGSAHVVVDDKGCYRCVADATIPWGAPGANTQGFHIEQCGYAAWTTKEWEKHLPMLHRVAYKIAAASKRFDIPIIFRDAADLEAGKHGVTTHNAVSRWQTAIKAPGDHSHTDPGPGYPMELTIALAIHYRKAM